MIGETILHYKIFEKLGEGGMGEVYKARDTKLDRFVALKFLPSQLTASEEDKARFVQEAKTASAMNHPNICTIYSIEEYDNDKGEKQLFIAMEYVEGKTLKDKKDSISEKQILETGIQVAEGLAAAHEKGIVHRDIKPENIMVRKDGIAQIMDFGLAKLYKDSNVSRLTKAGSTVGTMGYMSPEQVQGLDVDHRTDIFSLGVVLYELLAGESPFKGMHETAIMYEIVNVDAPPISTVKEGFDPELDEIILECLEKDKDERCQSAKELAKDLRKIKKSTGHRKSRVYNVNTQAFKAQPESQTISKSSGSITIEAFNKRIELGKIFSSAYLLWSLIGILVIAVLYFALFNKQRQKIPVTAAASILAPENIHINPYNSRISHDGKNIVFGGRDSTGNLMFWLRPVNSDNSRQLTNLNGLLYISSLPFWSYDDNYLFYFLNGKLKKLNIASGTVIDICNAVAGRGGTTNQNGDIVFAPNSTGGLYLVSANGGTPREIIKADSSNREESLRYPYFLPDGVHFIYSIEAKFSGSTPGDYLMIGSINSDIKDTLMQVSSNAAYADGYLFFVSQSTLMCQAFDADNFKLSGDIYTIAGNTQYMSAAIYGSFSVSNAGTLVFQNTNENNLQAVLTDEQGNVKEKLNTKTFYQSKVTLSPDGNKIAYSTLGSDNKNYDIWTYDYTRKVYTRITFVPDIDGGPIWSKDSKYIAYYSNRGKNYDIFIKKADGTGNDSLVYQSHQIAGPSDWSSDGRYILFQQLNPKTNWDIGVIDLKNKSSRYLFKSESNEVNAYFSFNMNWITYASDESGKDQVYVQSFNSGQSKWQVSTTGGNWSKWVNNDRAIIYRWQRDIYKVYIEGSGQNSVQGKQVRLFNTADKNILFNYDVSKDGKTFLAAASNNSTLALPITYVQNWKGLISGVAQ